MQIVIPKVESIIPIGIVLCYLKSESDRFPFPNLLKIDIIISTWLRGYVGQL